jgi:predicted anti-sigma-YlaC factor YlaD
MRKAPHCLFLPAVFVSLLLMSSCSINQVAVRAVAGFLEGSGESTVFSGDDDPELVGDALPFILKTYESLLATQPDPALALATGRTFVSYAYAFVQMPADLLPADKLEEQVAMRLRAKRLFLRGRDYVLQGLEMRHPGFRASEKQTPQDALRLVTRDDADYLYWAASAWMAAFSADPFDFAQIVALPWPLAFLRQVDAWDPGYGAGAVQEIFISFYGSAPADLGGSEQKARGSFAQAVALSKGRRAGPYIALATTVSVKNQDLAEFRALLSQALAVDVSTASTDRLVNIVNQRKARWLLDHAEDFFLEAGGGS